jgi:hypothetical protein
MEVSSKAGADDFHRSAFEFVCKTASSASFDVGGELALDYDFTLAD